MAEVINLRGQDGRPLRPLPHNLDAEQELLGAILVNNAAADKVIGFLREDHFANGAHRRIYRACVHLIGLGETVTPVTLKVYFEKDDELKDVGGTAYLARCAASATTIINAEQYGRAIYDVAIRRETINFCQELSEVCYDPEVELPAATLIEQAYTELDRIGGGARETGRGLLPVSQAGQKWLQQMQAAYGGDGKGTGLSTGIKDLDSATGGLHASDLIILAGRPSMGKSCAAVVIAGAAAKSGPVGFFSLEMSSEQVAARLMADATGIPHSHIPRGQFDDFDIDRMVKAGADLQASNIYVCDRGAISMAAIRSEARKLKRRFGRVALIVVDYLQLIGGQRKNRNDNRVQEVTEITGALKALAKDFECPVLALSQLSRKVEERDDKRPQLADLRESGSIEQDADVVIFIYREEYYLARSEPDPGDPSHADHEAKKQACANIAELIIGKQRHGAAPHAVKVYIDLSRNRIRDLGYVGGEI